MPTPPAPTNTLPCKECGHVNEPERVYCHNCGAKLDRSLLPKEEQVRRESPDRARQRIMRMANPSAGIVKLVAKNLAKTLLSAVTVACILLIIREPEDTPPAKEALASRFISSDLMDMAASPQVKTLLFSESDINGYLRSAKVSKTGPIPGVEYERSFVALEPGVIKLTVQRSVAGYPLYFGARYRAEAAAGVLTVVNMGGNIGALPIHPLVMQRLAPYLYADLFAAQKRDLATLQKVQALVIEKNRALVAGGAAKR